MRTMAVLTCLLFFANRASAQQEQIISPPKLAPILQIVTKIDKNKGQIICEEIILKAVPFQKEIVEIVNGQQEKKLVTFYSYLAESKEVVIEATNSSIITTDGKQLPIDEVWKRLKVNTVVAVSAVSERPDPAFLRALNAQTLIIIPSAAPINAIMPPLLKIKAPKN